MELVEQLVAEGRVRVAEPDDDEIAEWWRIVDYAKRHGLEPQGKRIEKTRFGARGLEISLAEGPHPNSRSQRPKGDPSAVPVRARLRSPHPAVAALRDDEERLVIPPVLRRRSLLMLQALAAEAVRRGHEVREGRSYYSRREGGVDVVVDGSRTPSPSSRSSRSPRIRSAPPASSWNWTTVGPADRAAGVIGNAGHWRTSWG
ncbi:hypothetical protein AB0D14_41340 [Streptomyces sp. NPDC048484]|uniref:hypothetical protein n=1 Tax=Streptomyces sp. NPDC048484 TaxID=3155146 RepID=UPI003437ADD5